MLRHVCLDLDATMIVFPLFFPESLVKDGQRSLNFRFIFPKSSLNNKLQEELVEPCHPGHLRGNGPEQDGIEMGCPFCAGESMLKPRIPS